MSIFLRSCLSDADNGDKVSDRGGGCSGDGRCEGIFRWVGGSVGGDSCVIVMVRWMWEVVMWVKDEVLVCVLKIEKLLMWVLGEK